MTERENPFAAYSRKAAKRFRPSLVTRARKRTVIVQGERTWTVLGDEKLSDRQTSYHVELPKGQRKYVCSCYSSHHGESRARRVCSHVLAVLLVRDDDLAGGPTVLQAPEKAEADPRQLEFVEESSGADVSLSPSAPEGQGEQDRGKPTSRAAAPAPVLPPDPILPRQAPGSPGLPEWIEDFRDHQWDAVREILDAFASGVRLVFLDAPTGAGKTLIGEMVRRYIDAPATYICSTKTLQDQFLRDYEYARVLKGRRNYPTQAMPFPAYTTEDCTGGGEEGCNWCPQPYHCPYQEAKREAIRAPISVLNTAYFLAETNFVRRSVFSSYTNPKRAGQLVIVDEADLLEEELMRFVEFAVSNRMLEHLGASAPKKGSHHATIAKWLRDLKPILEDRVSDIDPETHDIHALRRRTRFARLYEGIGSIAEDLASGENWVRDYSSGPMTLKPVTVGEYGPSKLWMHGDKWLLMSATLISPEQIAESLGWERDYEVVRVPMTFPTENRQLHIAGLANMIHKEKDEAWPEMVTGVRGVMRKHPNDRILVHTVSYELARYLHEELDDPRTMVYLQSEERESVIGRYLTSDAGVLLAPSLDRGVDFKGSQCRVIVVAKIPFPYLGDSQVSARMHRPDGNSWYAVQTVRKLVQMTGRGVRSADDWCETYILDAQFGKRVWKSHKTLLPSWWRDALDVQFPRRELIELGRKS